MPCADSSSSMVIKLDKKGRFKSYEYAKISCGREIEADTGLGKYFKGFELKKIVDSEFLHIVKKLKVKKEDEQFILYLEWDALRSAIALYLGIEDESIDTDRCVISSIEQNDDEIEIAEVILPPKEMPKILPCNLNQ